VEDTAEEKPPETKVSPGDPERVRTAYHEAGHVVVCHVLGFEVTSATIQPDGRIFGADGRVRYKSGTGPYHLKMENRILVNLAGDVAEAKGARCEPKGGAQDLRNVWNAIWSMERTYRESSGSSGAPELSEETQDAYQAYLGLLIRDLLNRKDVWAAVEKVAEQLLAETTLKGKQVHSLLAGLGQWKDRVST
jgi:ATP-dependent Zn protease